MPLRVNADLLTIDRFSGLHQRMTDSRLAATVADDETPTLVQPIPSATLRLWRRVAAAAAPSKLDERTQLTEMLTALLDEVERQRDLLRRVRCYAVVDPLGNPGAICLPHAARMLGIEADIDAALEDQ